MRLDVGEPDATPEPVPAKLVERYDYDPYGKTYIAHWDAAAGSGSADWVRHEPDEPSALGNPFMWTGQRHDVAIGLYHFPFRTCPLNEPHLRAASAVCDAGGHEQAK
jgi:hypothetical protein